MKIYVRPINITFLYSLRQDFSPLKKCLHASKIFLSAFTYRNAAAGERGNILSGKKVMACREKKRQTNRQMQVGKNKDIHPSPYSPCPRGMSGAGSCMKFGKSWMIFRPNLCVVGQWPRLGRCLCGGDGWEGNVRLGKTSTVKAYSV